MIVPGEFFKAGDLIMCPDWLDTGRPNFGFVLSVISVKRNTAWVLWNEPTSDGSRVIAALLGDWVNQTIPRDGCNASDSELVSRVG